MSNTIFTGLSGIPTIPTLRPRVQRRGRQVWRHAEKRDQQVDHLNQTSDQQVTQLLQGDRQDIHNVMIAVEKADVAFQLMMQVRNKIVSAYQEVSKLQF